MSTEQTSGKGYRSRMDITALILNCLQSGPQNQTKVMYTAYLSFHQTKEYKERLLASGLISVTEDGQWRITEQGRQWAKLASKMQGLEAPA